MVQRELKEFIYYLTHNKNLTKAQQLKRDELLARDYGRKPINEESKEKKKHSDETTRLHSPKGVIRFLRLFSVNDTLKWFTHKWDNNAYPISLETLFANLTFNNNLNGYCFGEENQGITAKLYYHVWNFIRPDKSSNNTVYDQFGEKFDTTWADLTEWCKENPGIWPDSFITPSGKSFDTIITRFKRTIEFRTDCSTTDKFGSQVRELINRAIVGSVKVEFTSRYRELGRDLCLYCNVNDLFAGIKEICEWVSSYKSKGEKLVVDMEYHNTYYLLTLFHEGSYFSGSQDKLCGLSGNFKSIREKLFSVCDFTMSSTLNGENIDVIALTDDMEMVGANIISPCKILPSSKSSIGVLYTLKLYK